MATKPLTKRQRYWLDHLTAAAKTNSSLVAYAKAHQLTAKQLYMWKTRLTALGHWPITSAENESGFVRVAATSAPHGTNKVSLKLPNGLHLEVQGVVDRHLLRELIAAAGEGA